MSDKAYVDVEIVEVVGGPEVDGKFFTAKCKVAGKDDPVKIKGYTDKKDCIAAGKTIRATWSEEYDNYFTVGESRKAGAGGGGRGQFAPRFSDTREGFLLHQRIIMAQSCLGHAVSFLNGIPADKAAEAYTSQNAVKLASTFFHALWADATAGIVDDVKKADG